MCATLRGNAQRPLDGGACCKSSPFPDTQSQHSAIVPCLRSSSNLHTLKLSVSKHESAICGEAAVRRLPCCQEKRPRLHCVQSKSKGEYHSRRLLMGLQRLRWCPGASWSLGT